MLELRLPTAESTMLLGRRLGQALLAYPAVRTVLLYGDLGAGKTTLTRALVEALPGGAGAEVSSPSFTLCNVYPTQPPVLHCDLYRSASSLPEELWEALDDGVQQPHVIIIEWAEYVPQAALPLTYLDIHCKICKTERLVTVTSHGESAGSLLAQLQHEDWTLE